MYLIFYMHLNMPPKRRRLEKRKRDPPKVEQYMAVAHLASAIAKLAQQEYQFVALLRQVADLTEHETTMPEKQWFHPGFEFSEDISKDIFDYVQRWLRKIVEHTKTVQGTRDTALVDLRKVDVLDNDSLKNAALHLTEAEAQCTTIQAVQARWAKIVRHEEGKDLQEHTATWLKRWLTQWKKLDTTMQQRVMQLQDALKAPFLQGACPESRN